VWGGVSGGEGWECWGREPGGGRKGGGLWGVGVGMGGGGAADPSPSPHNLLLPFSLVADPHVHSSVLPTTQKKIERTPLFCV